MKKLLSALLAVALVAALSAAPASADPGWGGRGWGHRHEFHGGGGFFPGYAFGAVTGLLLGGALFPPRYAAPVYVTPLPPACYTQPGYWSQAPVPGPGGYTTYQNVWVPPQTVCR